MRVLVTGGAGFVGHHFVEHLLKNTDAEIVVWDKLTYASTWDRLRDIEAFRDDRVLCLSVDFSRVIPDGVVRETGRIDAILHLGAETHVDNSISDPEPFIRSNVLGTHHVLQFARQAGAKLFYFSTDEVFGPAPDGVAYREQDRHAPGNPYAAAKAGGEMLVMAYGNTYGVPFVISRCMNIFGERQHPEKFIPTVIRKVLLGQRVTIHADASRTRAGARFYIHARSVAAAYLHLMGRRGVFHIVGEREVDNLALARMIAACLDMPLDYELVDFHSSRPGHDLRYALDGSKLAAAGWVPPRTFEQSLEKTVNWYVAHPRWLAA
jgi:dTDP-glucose 4,6-dehydratase